ncbi:MAG: hypothetical protein NXI01_05880 [Gammaproteobacteria bacterium]|nr:hypothetical protein [Gammaproteobacteria bacterium]
MKTISTADFNKNRACFDVYKAIVNDQYQDLSIENLEFDINQAPSFGVRFTRQSDGQQIDIRSGWTPTGIAIQFEKPVLLELFLLMGANPFSGYLDRNPINLIPDDSPYYEQMKQLLWQYQHPGTHDPAECVDNHKIIFNGNFIEALKKGDDQTVAHMLSEGTIYTDQCCYDLQSSTMAFTLAVKSKSFPTVALLVKRGATITDPAAQAFLQQYAEEPWCKSINQLLALEKAKQCAIMQLFCTAKGNLDLCRDEINHIRQQHQNKLQDLKEGKNICITWENYAAMIQDIENKLPNPATQTKQLVTNPYQNNPTQFFYIRQSTHAPNNHLKNLISATVFSLSVGGGITTIGLGVLLHNPHFALFAIPQLPTIIVGVITAIGALLLVSGLLISIRACNEYSSGINAPTNHHSSQQSP